MQAYFIVFLTVALWSVGSCGNDERKIACIHGKFQVAVGSEGYTTCHGRSGSAPIQKIKQCFQEVLKTAQVVKVAAGGKQRVDGAKFSDYASSHGSTDIGQAMGKCSRKDNAAEMYKQPAKIVQCVFKEVKRTCR